MRQQRPSAHAEKASGASAGCLLFLCAAGLLLSSCGDFTLFPEGFGPGPTPDPGDSACAKPFLGLDSYRQSPETLLGETLERAAAVAVVPGGMEFSFTPPPTEGTTAKTARPGDVLVADLQTNRIYVYLFNVAGNQRPLASREVFPAGAETLGGGLALYHEEVEDVDGTVQKVQLLLYTGTGTGGGSSLFVHDLSHSPAFTPNPFRVPDDAQGILPPEGTGFARAGAVAVGRSGNTRRVFVADARTQANGHRVWRINLAPQETVPVLDSMFVMADGFREIRDIGFSNQTRALYLTEFDISSAVYRLSNALTTPALQKSNLSPFVSGANNLANSTGLALVPTNNTATTEALLVLNQQQDKALQQFRILDGTTFRTLQLPMHQGGVVRQDVAYDCETARLFITQSKPTGTSTYNRFGLHALTPPN